MPKREVWTHLVDVAPPLSLGDDVAVVDQIPHYLVRGAFGDPDPIRYIPDPEIRLLGDTQQGKGMVRGSLGVAVAGRNSPPPPPPPPDWVREDGTIDTSRMPQRSYVGHETGKTVGYIRKQDYLRGPSRSPSDKGAPFREERSFTVFNDAGQPIGRLTSKGFRPNNHPIPLIKRSGSGVRSARTSLCWMGIEQLPSDAFKEGAAPSVRAAGPVF